MSTSDLGRGGPPAPGDVDAGVLGRLFSHLLLLEALPSAETMAAFLQEVLTDAPGVGSCAVRFKTAASDDAAQDADPGLGRMVIPIETGSGSYGAFLIEADDERALVPYRPYLISLASSVAVLSEDRERKEQLEQALADLSEGAERYRTLFESMAQGVVYQDADGRITAANPSAERILGLSAEQMEGLTSMDPRWRACREDGSELPGDEHPIQVALRTGRDVRDVVIGVFNPAADSQRWVTVSATPQFRPGELKPYRAFATFDDVTALKHVEDERLLLSETVQASLNEIYIFAADTLRFLFVNDGARRNLGYTAAQLAGMTPLDIKPELTRESFAELLKPLTLHETAQRVFRTVHRRADGSLYPVEVHMQLFDQRPDPVYLTVIQDITEREDREDELSRAQQLLSEAQSMSRLGGWEYDVAGDRVTWTDEVYCIHGLARDYDPNSAARDIGFYAPHSAPLAAEAFRRAVEAGEPYDLEVELDRADGERIWVRTIGRPVVEDGIVVRIVGNIMDITERKRTETALRDSEFKYRTVADNTYDWEWWSAPDGRYLYVSPSCERISGHSAAEFLADPALLLAIIHPDDRARLEQHLRTATGRLEADHRLEFRLTTPAGEERHIEHICQDVVGEDGVYLGRRGSHRDVTGQRRAEAATASLAAIVESSEDAIFGKTLDGTILTWNKGAERLYGYARQDIVGKSVALLMPPGTEDELGALLDSVGRGISVAHYETTRVCKDGSPVAVSLSISPIKDAAGSIVGAATIARDISERKQAEEQIQRLNAVLEQRVLDRTAQLDAANSELEAFAYSVSHDLRAPLRHISGFAALLEESAADSLDEKGRHYVERISSSVREMGVLIDDLLEFSRSGRAELRLADVDMSETVAEALRPLQDETADRVIEWTIGALPSVTGDPALLRQVWANLRGNAAKFTRGREPARIEVGVLDGGGGPHEGDGAVGEAGEDVFFVRDNGAGFDMQYAHKLFGVFQRLHSTAEFEGTGIGLANVQRIIHRHGGHVWAEAELDKGATFCFALPRRKERSSCRSTCLPSCSPTTTPTT